MEAPCKNVSCNPIKETIAKALQNRGGRFGVFKELLKLK